MRNFYQNNNLILANFLHQHGGKIYAASLRLGPNGPWVVEIHGLYLDDYHVIDKPSNLGYLIPDLREYLDDYVEIGIDDLLDQYDTARNRQIDEILDIIEINENVTLKQVLYPEYVYIAETEDNRSYTVTIFENESVRFGLDMTLEIYKNFSDLN
jgi:hypothetical protein